MVSDGSDLTGRLGKPTRYWVNLHTWASILLEDLPGEFLGELYQADLANDNINMPFAL